MHVTLDVATPTTEATATLTPSAKEGGALTPAMEKLNFKSSPSEPITLVDPANVKATHHNYIFNPVVQQRPAAKTLIDRQNRLIAAMLTRFNQLIKLATASEEDGATLENQASLSLQIEVEFQALVSPHCWYLDLLLTTLHR